MKEPTRLMSGSGPARELLRGSALRVPPGAKQRALQLTATAAGLTASTTAAAAAKGASLVKSLLLTVSLSAVGGGIVSVAVSEAFTRSEVERRAPTKATAPRAAPERSDPRTRPVASSASAEAMLELPSGANAETPEVPDRATLSVGASREKTGAVPTSRAAAPSVSPPEAPPRGGLFEEQRIIEMARAALTRGDATLALLTLDGYDRQYPQKQFGPEALALRVEALRARGQDGVARSLAEDFERRYPHHPLLTRVRGAREAR